MSARPTTGITIFNTLTGPVNEPVSVLDANFTAITSVVNDPLNGPNFVADTGSLNAYAGTSPLTITLGAAQKGLSVTCLAASTNTGPSTFNMNGLGLNPILNAGQPLQGGMIVSGTAFTVIWNGSNAWDLQGSGAISPRATLSYATLGIYTWS